MKIYCIHGYNGKANNTTAQTIKKIRPEDEVIAQQFDLLDLQSVYDRISEAQPDILVGNSLGGFYALTWGGNCRRIVVNPCMRPSTEIPKLDSTIDKKLIKDWERIELTSIWFSRYMGDWKRDHRTFGIFAKDDELFHYKEFFDRYFKAPLNSSILMEGTHKLADPELTEGLAKAFEFIKEGDQNEKPKL